MRAATTIPREVAKKLNLADIILTRLYTREEVNRGRGISDAVAERGEELAAFGVVRVNELYPWLVVIGSDTSGSLYQVDVRAWSCSCKGYLYHRQCKHLVAAGVKVLELIGLEEADSGA